MATPSSWAKPAPATLARFEAVLPDHPAAERRKMFGYPVCFVNGHYFIGLHQDAFVIRLPPEIRDRFPEFADARAFDPWGNGRGMKDWYEIPAPIAEDKDRLAALLDAAVQEVASLPPKEPARSKSRGKIGS
jgi:hypothetical protein